ncbi:uncharacterized protein SPSK_09611 [Sporothrix schenckii 1099-18]|uniref:Uncharacterized protein n=1 Tax=Sporothrix schenckii 1099-18 TaxID=1397361 RepID=A0A0F2MCV7_SPOSC|nr:uncharacterized protein SPSK_09611 [Sporothrix schenckii 1099-18]KJR85981.1 hypothetical protein SPSK_09611 [Sporothrix schenckii 1099-18]
MTFRPKNDYSLGFGSSDFGLGTNSGLGSDSGLSSGGSRLGSKMGTGGLGWSGGLRGDRKNKWTTMLGLDSGCECGNGNGSGSNYGGSEDMGGFGGPDDAGGGFGIGDSKKISLTAATYPVHLPVLLDNLSQLETARSRVFNGLDKYGDGTILAIFEKKWFKRLQKLCDHLGAQGLAIGSLLAHTTALPSQGLNLALQGWMAAATNNLGTLHGEMESVAVYHLITMAGDIEDASDMVDAVDSGDSGEIVDTATGIVVEGAAEDACEMLFGSVDAQLARCYKVLVQCAAEMDNRMMPALQQELSGGGWNVPPGPGRW